MQDGREKLVSGSSIRQEILETAIDWISEGEIAEYMARHQHNTDSQELWQYWQEVFDWVNRVFPNQDSSRTKIMKGLPWGVFYNKHKDDKLNAQALEAKIITLINDVEVDSKKGIYEYLLTGNEKTLSLRTFEDKVKLMVYEKQKGVCPLCKKRGEDRKYEVSEMEADHIIPRSSGGKTTEENCQMLCKMDNRTKSGT